MAGHDGPTVVVHACEGLWIKGEANLYGYSGTAHERIPRNVPVQAIGLTPRWPTVYARYANKRKRNDV